MIIEGLHRFNSLDHIHRTLHHKVVFLSISVQPLSLLHLVLASKLIYHSTGTGLRDSTYSTALVAAIHIWEKNKFTHAKTSPNVHIFCPANPANPANSTKKDQISHS